MKLGRASVLFIAVTAAAVGLWLDAAKAQSSNSVAGPDPRETALPPIKTTIGALPGVNDLPVRTEMPDVMTMNNGQKVTTVKQWKTRREEIKRTLEYYAIGQMPPPPGNVKGREIKSQLVLDGKVKYRLMHLTFGPNGKLGLDIGIFTPADSQGRFPTVIMPGGRLPVPRRCRPWRARQGKAAVLTPCCRSFPRLNPPTIRGAREPWPMPILRTRRWDAGVVACVAPRMPKRWPGATTNCFVAVMPT